jgi:hypothetical protein
MIVANRRALELIFPFLQLGRSRVWARPGNASVPRPLCTCGLLLERRWLGPTTAVTTDRPRSSDAEAGQA